MIAIACNYAKDVNTDRELILTEGMSAMHSIQEPLHILNIRRARETHQRAIRDNINKYGKIKKFSKNY